MARPNKKTQMEIFPDGAVLGKKRSKFRPDRNYVEKAVEQYLSNGGEIEVLEPEYVPDRKEFRSPTMHETYYEYRL